MMLKTICKLLIYLLEKDSKLYIDDSLTEVRLDVLKLKEYTNEKGAVD